MTSRKPKWRPPGQVWISPVQTPQVWVRDNHDGSCTSVILRVSPTMARWAGIRDGLAWDGVHAWTGRHLEAWNLWVPTDLGSLLRGFGRDWRRHFVCAVRVDGGVTVDRVPMWRAGQLHLGRTQAEM